MLSKKRINWDKVVRNILDDNEKAPSKRQSAPNEDAIHQGEPAVVSKEKVIDRAALGMGMAVVRIFEKCIRLGAYSRGQTLNDELLIDLPDSQTARRLGYVVMGSVALAANQMITHNTGINPIVSLIRL